MRRAAGVDLSSPRAARGEGLGAMRSFGHERRLAGAPPAAGKRVQPAVAG
jgi:hypothetical protein